MKNSKCNGNTKWFTSGQRADSSVHLDFGYGSMGWCSEASLLGLGTDSDPLYVDVRDEDSGHN